MVLLLQTFIKKTARPQMDSENSSTTTLLSSAVVFGQVVDHHARISGYPNERSFCFACTSKKRNRSFVDYEINRRKKARIHQQQGRDCTSFTTRLLTSNLRMILPCRALFGRAFFITTNNP